MHSIRAILITHAHYDHYGGLFDLFMDSPGTNSIPRIYCTEPTKRFLLDFGYKEWLLFGRRSHELSQPAQNRFFQALKQKIATLSYGREHQIGDVTVIFLPASHILGAAQIYVRSPFAEGLFTSDFKPSGTYLLRGFDVASLVDSYNIELAPDFIVTESTYGKDDSSRDPEQAEQEFIQAIRSVFELGGNILVPCFAIGRAQEFMTYYYSMMNKYSGITPLNIFFVGATNQATQIYVDAARAAGDGDAIFRDNPKRLLEWTNLLSVRDFETYFKAIGVRGDLRQKLGHVSANGLNVFITSGGMLQGPAHELFMELKDNPSNALFLVGYQARGSSGNAIIEASKSTEIKRRLRIAGTNIFVEPELSKPTDKSTNQREQTQSKPLAFRFKVLQFPMFSAHSIFLEKMDYLRGYASRTKKKIRFLTTHGTPENCIELADELAAIPNCEGVAPQTKEQFDF
jgi:putative mRNA 3-end processing factor